MLLKIKTLTLMDAHECIAIALFILSGKERFKKKNSEYHLNQYLSTNNPQTEDSSRKQR